MIHTGIGCSVVCLLSTAVVGSLVSAGRADADEAANSRAVTWSGRVIDRESRKPVAGAEVVVERSIRGADPRKVPAWAGETTMRTDVDGRFRMEFSAEQTAEPRLCMALRIRHPGYIRRKSSKVPLADLIRAKERGDEPFFATIPLERGLEYAAQVLITGGKPAAEIPYVFETATTEIIRPTPILTDDVEGRTDDQGGIRLRMPRTHALALYVGPPKSPRARFPYAPFQHFWGVENPAQHPNTWAPTDLGQIVLARGIRLPGRMVDTEGRPVAGQTVTAYALQGRIRHTAVTEDDGTFSLGPMRPGNYLIYGEGQSPEPEVDVDAPPRPRPARIVRPIGVYLKDGVEPAPVVLEEMPTVRVEVRFVDSKGKPVRGSATDLWGLLPPPNQGRPARIGRQRERGPTSEINAPERDAGADPLAWGIQDQPDENGRLVFPAPLGLRNPSVTASPPDEFTAYKYRLEPDGPPLAWGTMRLGVFEGDRRLTLISYRAPMVLVSVKTEDGGEMVRNAVYGRYTFGRQGYGTFFVRQSDGRYRSQSLMPDHEYQILARGGGRYDGQVRRVSLPEGGHAELSFVLRKARKPPEVGQPAPPFTVKTIDGRSMNLADLRGKTVLLHFWAPLLGRQDASKLKAIHDRFDHDERFAMIGLCLSDDSDSAAMSIRSVPISWPQALLRDSGYDPIAIDYAAARPDQAFLIGPDGRLIAQGRDVGDVEKALAKALGRDR